MTNKYNGLREKVDEFNDYLIMKTNHLFSLNSVPSAFSLRLAPGKSPALQRKLN
jgi:hypothetical protein